MLRNSGVAQILRYAVVSASILALVAMVLVAGCKKKYPTSSGPPAYTPADIKQLVKDLGGKKKPMGMGIKDMRVAAAARIGEIGPPAKEYGAIEALEKLAADKDPDANAAAQAALAKVKGS